MRIHALSLTAHADHLTALHHFYAVTLGLPATLTEDVLTVPVGGTVMRFTPGATIESVGYHFAFNVPADRFDAACAWLAARLPLITDATGRDRFHSDLWNSDGCYFRDPAGNIGELIARHDLPVTASDADFSARDLLYVSEIGLCHADVPSMAQRLSAALGVAVYRGEVEESFTPLGDAEGLLLLVKPGRDWYPETGVRAFPLPIRVTVSAHGQTVTLDGAGDGDYVITPATG